MTNEQIILNNRVLLMKMGDLKGTGELFTFVDENGKCEEIEMPEVIHTFNVWKSLGYVVKKGEHAIAKFQIWQKSGKKKSTEKQDGEEETETKGGKFYMKTAFFFTADQVEKIEN